MSNKIEIRNRNGKKIVLLLESNTSPQGLVFIMHGLSGYKEQPQIEAFADAFKKKGFTVVRFDTGNSCGESYGELENATATQYLQDLEDVLFWAKEKKWYEEPFTLVGHSLGSFCALLYAEKYPDKVKAIAPISTLVSGKLNISRYPEEIISQWKKEGVRNLDSNSGKDKKIKWRYAEDGLKYDVLQDIDKITMPALLIVGEKDPTTPVKDHELLYSKLDGEKELHVIKDAEHTFREKAHLDKIKNILVKWIEKTIT